MAMTKSLRNRIALANKYIRWAQKHGVWGSGYFGSTWPTLIEYTDEITVSPAENIVTVRYFDAAVGTGFETQRFDVRDEEGVADLRYEISNYIIKAIKNGAAQDGLDPPRFKA